MVSKEHRFHGLKSLNFVKNKGETIRGPYFSTKVALNRQRRTYRVAVVVSKKVSKSAVVRNRIRRRLYELVRHEEKNITKPYDIVIFVYDEKSADLSHKKLASQLKKQLKITTNT